MSGTNPQTLADLQAPGDGYVSQCRAARRTLLAVAKALKLDNNTPLDEVVARVRALQGAAPTPRAEEQGGTQC